MRTIEVSDDIWDKLKVIMRKQDFDTVDEVIYFLIKDHEKKEYLDLGH